MTRRVALALLVVLTAGPASAAERPLLVSVDWLGARLGASDLRVVDMASDAADYRRGHVPGAVHVGVDDIRVAVPSGGARLPNPSEAARLFARLAITPATTVVIYDDAGGLHAARLFYTLEVFGHARAVILDGGVQRWRAAGGPWTAEVPALPAADARWVRAAASERVADAAWVRDRLGDAGVVLLDTRSPAEFAGRDVRARRGGHIPGAVNVDWRHNLNPDGTFKPLDALRALYASAGVTPDKTVVTYCQTHHRAAHTYFVLRLLGYPRVTGYDRSWAEWGNRDDLPVSR